jgi:purine-binding chemotaxis protein CheW
MATLEIKQIENKLNSYLTFILDGENFAVNVAGVIEILEVPRITKIPRSPDYLRGVINLRGNVLPVIDTRLKFGMSTADNTIDTCVVVMEIEIEEELITIGAIVDAVKEVVDFEDNQIKPSPALGTKYNPEFIEGIVRVEEQFIMILNIGKVFSSQDALVLDYLKENK